MFPSTSSSGYRENAGPAKRGLRSEAALLERKCNKQAKRRIHRRRYRRCRSNIRGLADDTLEGRWGTYSHTLVKTTQGPQPLKDARDRTHTRLYEEHRNQNKADLTSSKLPYASMIKIVSFNSRSLLKPTMRKQIIHYMRAHKVHNSAHCLSTRNQKQIDNSVCN